MTARVFEMFTHWLPNIALVAGTVHAACCKHDALIARVRVKVNVGARYRVSVRVRVMIKGCQDGSNQKST